MRSKSVGIFLATGAGIIGGKYLFEPRLLEQKEQREKERELKFATTAAIMSAGPHEDQQALQSHPESQHAHASIPVPLSAPPPPSFIQPSHSNSSLTPSAIANTRTLACLPSTEISRSAHPDDAAKIMDEPLPSSPLIAKKIPSKEDSGEMQAEPYTKSPAGEGLFGRVRFW
ncbi:hypothetical protein AA313_de0202119 [Arthrobotrys entomopaga]|nr:hypothetical protein AA313_de0202119 [Arthrobotrys entomopaga]